MRCVNLLTGLEKGIREVGGRDGRKGEGGDPVGESERVCACVRVNLHNPV